MMTLPSEIADEATALFDDTRLDAVDVEEHAAFVIARVLDRGTLKSVRALVRLYGLDRIRAFFVDGGARQLSRRTVPLWASLLELPRDTCTPKSSPAHRSPYWTD